MSTKRNRANAVRHTSAAAALILAAGLGGCADYLSQSDAITVSAGNAQNHNKAIHIIDPWPVHAKNTKIPADGQRIERVIDGYSAGVIPPVTGPGTYEPPIGGFAGGGGGDEGGAGDGEGEAE